jgi:hypothetical protein
MARRAKPGRLAMAAVLLRGARSAQRQWHAIPSSRRERLQTLVRKSAGRPGNLSPSERRELQSLIGELNLGQVIRETAQRAATRRG